MQLICHNLQSFTKNTVALSSSRGIGPSTQYMYKMEWNEAAWCCWHNNIVQTMIVF